MATLYDVARAAGVSTATVSRVVHGHERVRPATRVRVQDVIDALGYVPDSAAQSLSRRRKEIVGLVSPERPLSPAEAEEAGLVFADEVLHGVEATLAAKGWSLLISFLRPGGHAYAQLEALSGRVDGLLVTEGIVTADRLRRLSRRVPVVVIAGEVDDAPVDVVAVDNRAGVAALVGHLVEVHGRGRLVYVDGPEAAPDALERRRAFEEAVAAHPGARAQGILDGGFRAEHGRAAARALLAEGPAALPDAVVCVNDQVAIGVLRALRDARVRVPDDVAVVGFDGIHSGVLAEPPLTTVRQPMRSLGERACARLLDRLGAPGRLPVRVEVLPTELVVRASCGCTGSPCRSA